MRRRRRASDGNSQNFIGKHRHGSRSGIRPRARIRRWLIICVASGSSSADRRRHPTSLRGNKHVARSDFWSKNFKHDRLNGGRPGNPLQRTARFLLKGVWPYPTDHQAVGVDIETWASSSAPLVYICVFPDTDRMVSPRALSHFRSLCIAPRRTLMCPNFGDFGRHQESLRRKRWFAQTPLCAKGISNRIPLERYPNREHTHSEMWRLRHHIETKRRAAALMHVLTNQRNGGWGLKHLANRFSDMPFFQPLAMARNSVPQNRSGGLRVLHLPPLPAARTKTEEDTHLELLLANDQTLTPSGGCFMVDDIRRARHSLPRWKTCGDGSIVTDVIEACNSADWFGKSPSAEGWRTRRFGGLRWDRGGPGLELVHDTAAAVQMRRAKPVPLLAPGHHTPGGRKALGQHLLSEALGL